MLVGTVILTDKILPVRFTVTAELVMLGIVGLIACYNLVLQRRTVSIRRWALERPEQAAKAAKRLAHIQIIADLICLAIILNFSGGLINPLCIFMVFHVAIAGIMLASREAFAVALLASVLLTIMGITGQVWPAIRSPLEGFPLENMDPPLTHNWFYIFSICEAMTCTFFLIAYFTSGISVQLREAYRNLADANLALQQRDLAKSRFMRVLAHQLRSPLAAIVSLIHVFGDSDSHEIPNEQRHLLDRIHNRCHCMMEMVDDLLRLTKLQQGLMVDQERNVFDLTEAIRDTLKLYEEQAQEKGLDWQVRLPTVPARISASERDISDLVSNLVANAIKYTGSPGTINIEGNVEADNYVLQVADTGIGIPQEDQQQLFDEFFRAGNARKVDAHGTGLGLSIVNAVAEQLGGQVDFQSKENKGTTFCITIPLNEEQQHGNLGRE